MTVPYHQILEGLRQAFPQPVSDRMHDAYFVFSFLRALDQVDALKSVRPLLGQQVELDYESAKTRRLEDDPVSLEEVTGKLVEHLSGLFIWGHPHAQINVVPVPAAVWLFGSALGLMGAARRRSAV